MSKLQRLNEWIGRWRYPAVPILLGILLAAPSLIVGIQADDLLYPFRDHRFRAI